jgi:hypothetical protein
MGLREDLLRGIYAYGFEKPSAIQQRAIKPVKKPICFISSFHLDPIKFQTLPFCG